MIKEETEIVVLGGGPGGYTAAFRAADLGKNVILVEKYNRLGGVCLNVGCIPSKAFLHISKVINDSINLKKCGISFQKPNIDINELLNWKEKIISNLSRGLQFLAKERKVKVLNGYGKFVNNHSLEIVNHGKIISKIQFKHAIIAAGSHSMSLQNIPIDKRILNSTSALELQFIPKSMLVIGGGAIGLEMAMIYHQLGSKIDIIESMPQLMFNAIDIDIIKQYYNLIKKRYNNIFLNSTVNNIEAKKDGIYITIQNNKNISIIKYDAILIAIGRKPNGNLIAADKAGININKYGYINVDKQMRTNISNIYAIGDIVGSPMLAHKSIAQAKIAAEVISGKKYYFEPKCIPIVAYTDPEIASVGITEREAMQKNIEYGKGIFPWMANGRSLILGRNEGLTKIIFDKKNKNIIGCSIIGPDAGNLISESALAIEMGSHAEDISLTIHPHPTLSETIPMATEIFEKKITDLYLPD